MTPKEPRLPKSAVVLDASTQVDFLNLAEIASGLDHLARGCISVAANTGILPLRKFKISDLVVHPYHVRPASAHTTDLQSLSEQLRKHGQHDPIHVIPYTNGWAIMDGQRRWLAAPAAGLTELSGWEHPAPDNPFEVYAFGRMIHASRKNLSALDYAVVWGRMLVDRAFNTPTELARRAGVDAITVSRTLAILNAGARVLGEIRRVPDRFTDRHLYAIFQIYEAAGEEEAVRAAISVRLASPKSQISARRLELLVASYQAAGKAPARGRQETSVSLPMRVDNDPKIGEIKA